MRIPRDITGIELIKILGHFGYEVTKQTGSHIRLTTKINGEHHVTVPRHDPLKVGTLNSILKDIAEYLKISKEELMNKIFA
jgi:predicted RNA binding protein YcfA (HicA-like mRNA interferase family)